MDDIQKDLPMSMTIAAFIGISWYIGIEINVSLFMLFQRQRGLYFWSCALCSWGVILQPLFIILADFRIWTDLVGSITMIYLTWFILVIPHSWVLYSRLYLIVQDQKLLRHLRYILMFNSVVFSVPTVIIGIIAQATNINLDLRDRNIIWDRVQLTVFFVQETTLSVLYIYETRKHVNISSQLTLFSNSRSAEKGKSRVLRNLINANLLVIVLDIALLGIQYGGNRLFYLQGAFKPCVYGVKLKVEFLVLNQLIESLKSRAAATSYRSNNIVASGDHVVSSNLSRARGSSSDPIRVKMSGHVSVNQIGLESMNRGLVLDDARSGDCQSSHSETVILRTDEGAIGAAAAEWNRSTNETSNWHP